MDKFDYFGSYGSFVVSYSIDSFDWLKNFEIYCFYIPNGSLEVKFPRGTIFRVL